MIEDLAYGISTMIRHAWTVATVPPIKRPFTRFYPPAGKYWEADVEHQATVLPPALRRDWQGRQD